MIASRKERCPILKRMRSSHPLKGKDRSLIENWRPISLVNVDAKMMSKVIWKLIN